jgi:hypothetical protein
MVPFEVHEVVGSVKTGVWIKAVVVSGGVIGFANAWSMGCWGSWCAEEWLSFAELEIGMAGCAVTEVQVVVQAVCVIMTTVDSDDCWFGDKAALAGVLTAGAKVVSGTLEIAGTMLLTTSSSIKEVGKVLAASKELIEVEESEQLVSVTVVLSVTVTVEMCWYFERLEARVLEKEVWLMLLAPVEKGKKDTDPPGTGGVTAVVPEVVLKMLASMLLQRRGRSTSWAGWWSSPWLVARTELCLSVNKFVVMLEYNVNLQGKLSNSQEKMDDPHGEEG